MAPIPRCELRPPSEPSGRQSSKSSSPGKAGSEGGSPSHASAQPQYKKRSSPTTAPSQRSLTRDSAEILEGAKQFSTELTRDAVEVRDHHLHEGVERIEGAEKLDRVDEAEGAAARVEGAAAMDEIDAGAGSEPCTVLEQCRTKEEATSAKAEPVDSVATPGDVDVQFEAERPESPSSGYITRKATDPDKKLKKSGVQKCKGTYTSLETYESLWGSSKAVGARKKLELEMKKKRRYYEYLHERNKRRREKERRRAKEKRKMMRCRDQSKIPQTIDNISINKAFYFRFNYNKRLPFMPSAMDQHFRKFKKPPFRRFHKGFRPCRKEVDEFEKLRVTDVKGRVTDVKGRVTNMKGRITDVKGRVTDVKGRSMASKPPIKRKA